MNTHAINWFEIPVSNFDRAKKFYEAIFQYEMPEAQMGPARMGFLLYDMPGGGCGGAIVHNPEFYTPANNGTLVYLNCNPSIQAVIDRVAAAGGKLLQDRTEVAPNMGFWAVMEDTEGNRVALHAME